MLQRGLFVLTLWAYMLKNLTAFCSVFACRRLCIRL